MKTMAYVLLVALIFVLQSNVVYAYETVCIVEEADSGEAIDDEAVVATVYSVWDAAVYNLVFKHTGEFLNTTTNQGGIYQDAWGSTDADFFYLGYYTQKMSVVDPEAGHWIWVGEGQGFGLCIGLNHLEEVIGPKDPCANNQTLS